MYKRGCKKQNEITFRKGRESSNLRVQFLFLLFPLLSRRRRRRRPTEKALLKGQSDLPHQFSMAALLQSLNGGLHPLALLAGHVPADVVEVPSTSSSSITPGEPVIGDSILRPVVGANLVRAGRGQANLQPPLRSRLLRLPLKFKAVQQGGQLPEGNVLVQVLVARLLRLHRQPGGQVGDADAGEVAVHILAARPGGVLHVELEVRLADHYQVGAHGEDGEGDGAGVDASVAFSFGNLKKEEERRNLETISRAFRTRNLTLCTRWTPASWRSAR